MSSVLQLQSSSTISPQLHPSHQHYIIDMGTLEHIAAVAARKKSLNLIHTIWDYIEILNGNTTHFTQIDDDYDGLHHILLNFQSHYQATPFIYETTILAFFQKKFSDHLALNALAQMEDHGHIPSRSFINEMSNRLISSAKRVDNAYHFLTNDGRLGGHTAGKPTTASMNLLLASYAQLGQLQSAFDTHDTFESDFGLISDYETYSYLMEAIHTTFQGNTKVKEYDQTNRRPSSIKDEMGITEKLHLAHEVMNAANEAKPQQHEDITMKTKSHLIHQYVQVLCSAGQMDQARNFLKAITNKDEFEGNARIHIYNNSTINIGTFEILAVSYALDDTIDKDSVYEDINSMCHAAGYINGLPSCHHSKV
eukprot:CAMPEP_0184871092 /NCGR_PEP_ID=MMETSP0580-20130426/39902_1 /TAXON_ID=1118495 /ORGANISM="Dactyliosolen fragilissimus" /LENGTH=365 /DNA_ID=CAMNT_0027373591 /DNA_START=1342 /DNA_END=2439 /DNA_ORIENTATION=+